MAEMGENDLTDEDWLPPFMVLYECNALLPTMPTALPTTPRALSTTLRVLTMPRFLPTMPTTTKAGMIASAQSVLTAAVHWYV
jgi:hypothetical protein